MNVQVWFQDSYYLWALKFILSMLCLPFSPFQCMHLPATKPAIICLPLNYNIRQLRFTRCWEIYKQKERKCVLLKSQEVSIFSMNYLSPIFFFYWGQTFHYLYRRNLYLWIDISDSMTFRYSWGLVKMVCLLGYLYGQMVEMMKEFSVWYNNGFESPVKTFL